MGNRERWEGSKKHSRTFTRNTYIHPIDQSINQSINQSIKTLDSGGRMSSSTRSTPARQGSTSRQSVRASSHPERNAQKDWRKFFLNSGSAFAPWGKPSQDDLYTLDGTDWQSEYDGKRHSEAREGVFGLKTEYASAFPRQ